MARITVILEDTPAGGVSVQSDFQPAIGSKCSLAQSAALEIMNRTARDYGLPPSFNPSASTSTGVSGSPPAGGTDL